jgi:hypothetical protein
MVTMVRLMGTNPNSGRVKQERCADLLSILSGPPGLVIVIVTKQCKHGRRWSYELKSSMQALHQTSFPAGQ